MDYLFYSISFVTLSILSVYLKLSNGVYKGNDKLSGKTVIITGADSGIGLFCAKDFARRGAKVIMLSCNMVNGKMAKDEVISETGNNNVKLKYIDFLNLKTVRKCATEILTEEPSIHILLNNAGVAKIGIYETVDSLDAVTQVNYFGPFLLTNLLLGKIKSSAPSRIVNVSSIAHRYGNIDIENFKISNLSNEWILYANSKLAMTCFSNELSRKLKGTDVTVNCLHPGVFFSGITKTLPHFVLFLWRIITNIFLKTIREAAQTSIYLCVSPEVENVTGEYFEDCKKSKSHITSRDFETCKNLWNLTEVAVNLQDYEKHL